MQDYWIVSDSGSEEEESDVPFDYDPNFENLLLNESDNEVSDKKVL